MSQPHPDAAPVAVKCAILTVSDTRPPEMDKSGDVIRARLHRSQHQVVADALLKDEPEQVRQQVINWVAVPDVEVILVNGGTGIAPRDTTYEAIAGLLTKTLPGFGELLRMLSYEQIGSRAIASRAFAGVCQSTLIFSMPGSSKAVELAMDQLIAPELVHLTTQLRS